jgi:hypothetical protein
MKMSDGEKLIAMMLADLLEHLEVRGEINTALIKEAIYGDDLWAIQWGHSGLFHNEGPSDEIVDETAKIMTMCRVLENSIAELSDHDREQIPERQRRVFEGFDGNEEPHYGVAVMLLEQLNRYREFQDRDLNSHHNTLEKYRAMREVFDQVYAGARPLSLRDIQTVLAAPNR